MAFFDADFMRRENEKLKQRVSELEAELAKANEIIQIKEDRINKMIQEQATVVKNRFIPKQKTEPAKTETETEETKTEE